jgi:hypothetical protein
MPRLTSCRPRLATGGSLRGPAPADAIVHRDVAPWNLLERDGDIVGLVDWDLAGPGRVIADFAYLAWHFVPLYDEPTGDGSRVRPRPRAVQAAKRVHGVDASPGSPAIVLVVWTDNTDTAFEQLRSAGAGVVQPPHDTGNNNRNARLRDPDGNSSRSWQR